jgi:hypothetical protein
MLLNLQRFFDMMNETKKRATRARFDYNAHNIVEHCVKALEEAAVDIQALGRRSTDQAFQLGKLLERTSALAEAGTYEKWVTQRCDISPKTARNYRSVARHLEPYRERVVDLAISPTVLFHLASAPAEKIEEALVFAKENNGLRVKEVKAIVGEVAVPATPETTSEELSSVGGLGGLRALIELKTKAGIIAFLENASALQSTLVDVLQTKPEGKRLQKNVLIPVLEPLARAAKRSLGNVVLLEATGDVDVRKIDSRDLLSGSGWFTVFEALDHLGNRERWPGSSKLEMWLAAKVMPLLEWATTRAKQPQWPLAEVATKPEPNAIIKRGLEMFGAVVRVEPPNIPAGDFEPPDFLKRTTPATEVVNSNVIALESTARAGLRKPSWAPTQGT